MYLFLGSINLMYRRCVAEYDQANILTYVNSYLQNTENSDIAVYVLYRVRSLCSLKYG